MMSFKLKIPINTLVWLESIFLIKLLAKKMFSVRWIIKKFNTFTIHFQVCSKSFKNTILFSRFNLSTVKYSRMFLAYFKELTNPEGKRVLTYRLGWLISCDPYL